MRIINASIDLTKIDKSKIVTTDKNGQPFKNGGKYLNVSIILKDEPDNYGNDTSISINQSKEEREAGEQRIYIGNGKTVYIEGGQQQAKPTSSKSARTTVPNEDDLPF